MGLFRRTPSRFPADMLEWLDTYGRHRLDRWTSGIDGGAIWGRLEPLLEELRRDPDGFLADLEELVAGARGSFVTLGAGGLAWEALNHDDPFRFPAAGRLIDAGIAFKVARGLPSDVFAIYETERWLEVKGERPYEWPYE
jgi:photosystem II stability/assembly factor-like uncharacterized protein